jgi:hypothetical protein
MNMLAVRPITVEGRAALIRTQTILSSAYGELAIVAQHDPDLHGVSHIAADLDDARRAISDALVPREQD